jgi:hypothetical protein
MATAKTHQNSLMFKVMAKAAIQAPLASTSAQRESPRPSMVCSPRAEPVG